MNKERRKTIDEIIDSLNKVSDDLYFVQEEEQSAYDNLSDGLKETERGERIQECADELQDAFDNLRDVIESLEYIINEY